MLPELIPPEVYEVCDVATYWSSFMVAGVGAVVAEVCPYSLQSKIPLPTKFQFALPAM